MNKIKKTLYATAAAAVLFTSGYKVGVADVNNRVLGIDEIIQLDSGQRTLPFYSSFELKNLMCAKYARLAAKEIFNLDYIRDHAWNFNKNNKVTHSIDNFTSLENLIDSAGVSPGDIIGTYNPHSSYNDKLDDQGKKIEYTHLLLYFGNMNQEPLFAHFYGSETLLETIPQLKKRGLSPREVIVPKP